MKNKIVAIGIAILLLIGVAGCSDDYDKTEKHVVNVTVSRTEKKSRWVGKCYTHIYNIYFETEDGIEWEVENHELFNLLEEGNVVSVFRTDYIKGDEIIRSEFDFIN